MDDAVDLELEEEAVAAGGGELSVEDDLADLRVRLRMHVRVREIAVAQRDEVTAVADVRVDAGTGLPLRVIVKWSFVGLFMCRAACVNAISKPSARTEDRGTGRGVGVNAPATNRSRPRTVFVPPTSKSANAR